MASTYAIDFVPVDGRGRSAHGRDWRTWLATEPPERFVGYGRPILAPAEGVVVHAHDGEVDHEARRSQLTLVPYALSQRSRLARGVVGLAGNHVVVALHAGGHVALAHLRSGSLLVSVGERVAVGQPLGACGNSGNSTQPHLHLQVMDGPDAMRATALPLEFSDFHEWPDRRGSARTRSGVPAEGSLVAPLQRDDHQRDA